MKRSVVVLMALSVLFVLTPVVGAQEVSNLELVFTKNNEIYRLNMMESATGKIRHTLIANDFAGWKILRRPGRPGQFMYVRQNSGFVLMDRCGTKIFDFQREGTGARFENDFVWSHSGQYIVYGVYNGAHVSSPDPGVNRLNPDTGESKSLVLTKNFTYDHSPAYSLDDKKVSYIHHEGGAANWFRLIDSEGGDIQLSLLLPATSHDAHQFFTWVDQMHVLGINTAVEALILIDVSGSGSYQTFPVGGSTGLMIVSPTNKRFALNRTSKLTYGDIGNYSSLKDVGFNEGVQSLAWVDDNSIVTYTSKAIYWVDLVSGEVIKITDTSATGTFGIEVLTM